MRIPPITSRREDLDKEVNDLDTGQRIDLVNTLYTVNFEVSLKTRYMLFRALSQMPNSLEILKLSRSLQER